MIPLRDSQPSRTTPVVTIALIAVNVFVFLHQVSLDAYSGNHFIAQYGVIPARLQLSTLATSMFLHGGWMHLIGNMWFLWIYGDNVEDVLGRARYILFYVVCGVAAGLVHVIFNAASPVPTIGASGAVAGVMGGYLLKFPHARIVTLIPIFVFFTTIEIPAVFILVYWFLLQLVSGLGSVGHSNLSEGGVAWFAHIGGFVAGLALLKALGPKERYRHRRELHW